jgi:hypothetical protein
MPTDKLVTLAIDVVLVVVAAVLIYLFGGGILNMIQAPAKLDSALGDNAALAAGAKAQGDGIKAVAKEGVARKAASAKAVEAAGTKEAADAKAILGKKAPGSTPLERAHNRIDAELVLQ